LLFFHGMVFNFETIGAGEIGTKAEEVRDKALESMRLGLRVPPSIALAEEFFLDVVDKALKTENPQRTITYERLSPEKRRILEARGKRFGSPLAIRSSAVEDGRGTGIYSTVFCTNNVDVIERAVMHVLASDYSPDAIQFREDAHKSEGFGVLMQPLIGRNIDWGFGPLISGVGYTSTMRGEGYVTAVPGLGGGVISQEAQRISPDELGKYNGRLMDFILDLREMRKRYRSGSLTSDSALVKADGFIGEPLKYKGKLFREVDEEPFGGVVQRNKFSYSLKTEDFIYGLNFGRFFDTMKKLEESIGMPQYFEYAIIDDNAEPAIYLTQIADANEKLDPIEFGNLENIIMGGRSVRGSGIMDCQSIVLCLSEEAIKPLREYNARYCSYLLYFSSDLTSEGTRTYSKLGLRDFNNADVFVELQETTHYGNPQEHLSQRLWEAGKIFAVYDPRAEDNSEWVKIMNETITENGFAVINLPVRAYASQGTDRFVLTMLYK
jgi:hypothetical protein